MHEEDHITHHPAVSPIVGCRLCKEWWNKRRSLCFGDGSSNIPVPTPTHNE